MANALNKVNSAGIEDGSVVNADINASAAIALSKLASTPSVLTGSTDNQITTVTGANAIQGEANLTFDGTTLNITDTELSEASDNFTINIQSGNNDFYVKSGGTTIAAFKGLNKHLEITDGDLVIGTAGHGIDFSAQTQSTSTTNSELLDHYEEGNWVPVFANGLVASAYETNGQRGAYTRVGNVVYITGALHLATSSTQDGNVIDIHGLPFTSGTSSSNIWDAGGIQNYYSDAFYNANDFSGIVNDNSTTIRLYKKSDGTYLTGSDVNGGREMRFSGSYLVPT